MQQTVAGASSQEGSTAGGFFILIGSFFTMPIKTLKLTAQELREVGRRGRLDIGRTNIPHLTWLEIAGHLVISITIIGIVAAGVVMGLASLAALKYSAKAALSGLILSPVVGILAAIAADWLMAVSLELLGLLTGIANDIRRMANK